ncbi:MAG TPA: hypothetical protein VK054_01330, partial [Beutenbergiaceae bacterium]|nr:hypothetical protein [Beutenbergiaceae bacterium]
RVSPAPGAADVTIEVREILGPEIVSFEASEYEISGMGTTWDNGDPVKLEWAALNATSYSLEQTSGPSVVTGIPSGATGETGAVLDFPANTTLESRSFRFTLSAFGDDSTSADTYELVISQLPMYREAGAAINTTVRPGITHSLADEVWFSGAHHLYRRTATGDVQSFALGSSGAMPIDLAFDESRSTVWIVSEEGGSLVRFEVGTEEFSYFPLPLQGNEVRALAVAIDGDGYVWVGARVDGSGRGNYLLRFDPEAQTFTEEALLDHQVFNIDSLAVDDDGIIWITLNQTLHHVDSRDITNRGTAEIGGHLVDLTVGPSGDLWVLDLTGNKVYRLSADPRDVGVRATIGLSGQPRGITVVDGRVWVTIGSTRQLSVIDPGSNRVTSFSTPTFRKGDTSSGFPLSVVGWNSHEGPRLYFVDEFANELVQVLLE